MPKPKQPFNPIAAAKAVVSSATRQVTGDKDALEAREFAGQLDKPERPAITPRVRGVSLLASSERLPQLSMRRASTLSVLLHVVTPVALVIGSLLFLLILSWIMHFNFWDLFKHKTPQDMTFTLVDDAHTKRPDNPLFKGNANQQAGGKQEKKQPLNPGKETAIHPPAKEAKPAPPAKPKMVPPKPQQQAVAPSPEPKPVAESQKTVQKQQPEPVKDTPTIGKPAKAEKVAVQKPEAAQPKRQPPKAAQKGTAPEPMQVSTMTTDFGVSTTPPGSASSGNPQEGKAKNAGVDVAQDVDYGPFMANLQKRIQRNWIPPRGMESRKLVLMFYVRRDGQVVKVEVEKSSGDAGADRSAIEAVQVSAPFMAFPPQIKEDILPVEFTFDYNVLNPKNSKKALNW